MLHIVYSYKHTPPPAFANPKNPHPSPANCNNRALPGFAPMESCLDPRVEGGNESSKEIHKGYSQPKMHLLVVMLTNRELRVGNLLASYNGQQIHQAIRYPHIWKNLIHCNIQCMHACNNRAQSCSFCSTTLVHFAISLMLTDVNYNCQIK